jgi:REP element-mobilizing transposase RayT
MKYDPEIHNRRSIRLKGYDYANLGAYFVTICARDKACLFGEIIESQIQLNKAGKLVYNWWIELINKFKNIELDMFIIMPNHIHGIIYIVGADLCVCPDGRQDCPDRKNKPIKKGAHSGAPLHRIVQWFKTMTTNEYLRNIHEKGWDQLNGKVWQRNYYERVIRNEEELNQIKKYILNNPIQWDLDSENPAN